MLRYSLSAPELRIRSMAMWRLLPLLVCSCLTVAACGGNSVTGPTNTGGGGSSGQVTPIKGGEKLAWDQVAASFQAAQALTFTLWLDGAAAKLTNASCTNVRSSAGYECSGVLPTMAPGRHSLELSAIASGRESTRSAPFVVMVGGGSLAPE